MRRSTFGLLSIILFLTSSVVFTTWSIAHFIQETKYPLSFPVKITFNHPQNTFPSPTYPYPSYYTLKNTNQKNINHNFFNENVINNATCDLSSSQQYSKALVTYVFHSNIDNRTLLLIYSNIDKENRILITIFFTFTFLYMLHTFLQIFGMWLRIMQRECYLENVSNEDNQTGWTRNVFSGRLVRE